MHLTVTGKPGKSCQTITKMDRMMGSLPTNSWYKPAAVTSPLTSVRYSHFTPYTLGASERVVEQGSGAFDPTG